MSSYLDALLSGAAAATKLATATSGVFVDVGNAPPPVAKQVLTATSPTTATWQVPQASGDLETNVPGAPVDISGAAPPVEGQVLTATSPTTAIWRVPGLHYDPGIKFWTSSIGSATITPGTWGFIQQAPGATDPIVVYIVSSLAAPPIDSRFALYVGRDVTVPVTVSVLGASQIQGLDGVLGTSTTLLPGSDYEWVFYHEDSSALWGLVSDTAAVAKRIAVAGGVVEVASSPAPIAGYTLVATGAAHAVWSSIGGSTAAALADAFANALYVDAIVSSNSDLNGNSGGSETDGIGYGQEIFVLTVSQSDNSENGFWKTHDGAWVRAPGYPLPGATTVGQLVIAGDGTEFAGSSWVYLGADEWGQIAAGSPITGGDFMVRVGNKIHLVGPITAGVHGNLGGGALHADATTTVSGFFTGAEKVKLSGIATSAAAVTSVAPTQITATATAAAGSQLDAARRDHIHSIATAAPSTLVAGGVNTIGTSANLARADHIHQIPAYGTASATICQGNDARLSDDRVASALRTTTNTVNVSSAVVPSAGQVLCATSGSAAGWASPAFDPGLNGLRISHTADDSLGTDGANNTIFLAHAKGNTIALYDGANSRWLVYTAAGASGAITYPLSGRTAGLPFDVFVYWNGSTLVLEPLDWTNATTRATPLLRTGGVWVKQGDASRRYLGTVRPRSATTYRVARAAAIDGNSAGIDYWNYDNRRQTGIVLVGPNTPTYAYATAAWRQANGAAAAQIDVIAGIAGDPCFFDVIATATTTNATVVSMGVGIGINSTTATSSRHGSTQIANSAPSIVQAHLHAHLCNNNPLGVTQYAWLEYGAASSSFVGINADTKHQPGMSGLVWF